MPFRLSLVGEGQKQTAVQALAKELGLSGRVDFLGARDDVSHILAKANVFVLTSNWEGLPISILEAMRAGLPVIASDVGGVREAVIDGESGFLVDRGNLILLRSRLQQLLSDSELRKKMGEAGRKCYLEHFTVERMLEATLRVYNEVLTKHPSIGTQHRSL
jgi:glycosyltransferase involved in cell wall biosynthesis